MEMVGAMLVLLSSLVYYTRKTLCSRIVELVAVDAQEWENKTNVD